MSKSRSQPLTGVVSCRRASSSSADRRPAKPPAPTYASSTQSHGRRATSITTSYRDRPTVPPRPKSSERLVPDRKTPAIPVGRTEHPLKQPTRQDGAGNRKSPRNQNKRPPFVVGAGNSTAYRSAGGGGYRAYSTTKTESHSRSNATSSKDRRAVTGRVPAKDPGAESKTSKAERPAVHGTETMTLLTNSVGDALRLSRDRADRPEATESSATIIVTDPLPEVFFHRTNRKQHHPSPDECIKQAAEKLSEFAASQNSSSGAAAKSDSTTGVNGTQHPPAGNDATKGSYLRDGTEILHPLPLVQDAQLQTGQAVTVSSGNDTSSAPKQVGGTSKKAAEVHRTGPTRLSAACRPSPTRSSLLRRAHNCPASAGTQPRVPRPTRPTVGSTHLGTENHLQTPLRQHVIRQGRGSSVPTPHDAAAQPTK